MTVDRAIMTNGPDPRDILSIVLGKACLPADVRRVFEEGALQHPSLTGCAIDTLKAIACDHAGWAAVEEWLSPQSLLQKNTPIEILQGDFTMIRYLREDVLERTYLSSVIDHALGPA